MSSRAHKPRLGYLRMADPDDSEAVMKLINEPMARVFKIESLAMVTYLIENGIISVVQLDNAENIVGFLSLKDYPMVPSVHPSAWEEFVWTKYKSCELKPRNTLWIHLICWQHNFGREVVDSMLKSVFMHDQYVQHIAYIKATPEITMLVPGQARAEASFRKASVVERGTASESLPSLMVADRSEVCPKLRIRRAVEEDNDDIVPIIERHSKRLREIYGDYYISELISRHPESERALLVCEHKEVAVGIICLNTQINYTVLEESFDLSPFAGLKHSERMIQERSVSISKGLATISSYSSSNISQFDSRLSSKYKISWLEDDDSEPKIDEEFSDTFLDAVDLLKYVDDEDNDLEYDIINITDELIKLPPTVTENRKLTLPFLPGLDPIEKDTSRRSSRGHLDIVRFEGEPNAFLIELFAMHHDYDERNGFDILEAAFEIFPDRDYCVICLPSNHPSFPLLEHFTLVTPFGNRMRFINHSLYVVHKNSVRGEITVRGAERSDTDDVMVILEHTQRQEFLIEVFERSLESLSLSPYLLLSENQPVGIAILGPLEDSAIIRNQFVLGPEPRRAETDGVILLGVMSPALEPHARWFLRELIRHSQYTTLFWFCPQFAKGELSPSRNLMSLTSQMSPRRCRVGMVNITAVKETEKYYKEYPSFALWVIERGLTSLPKLHVNNSIVVVGASRTGLSFIETLIIGNSADYLTFTNITLVSEHGLPTVSDSFKAAEICIPKEGRYTDKYLKCIPFYFYIDIICSVMKSIDRRKKCIYLKDGSVKYYDELVLTCGKQFQHPDYLTESVQSAKAKEADPLKPCNRILMDNPDYLPDSVPDPPSRPINLLLINNLYEANYCLKKLLALLSEANAAGKRTLKATYPIAVYGDCLEAYTCMAGLIELGISPKNIIFIEPFPSDDEYRPRVNCFNNESVDEKVQAALELKGIRVYRQCRLSSLKVESQRIVALQVMSAFHSLTLPCFALFYYGTKAIDLNAFRAINQSGLVYDGGLVIGSRFETNDPAVFGAGPCTRYSRRLYATRWNHEYYYSEEVGTSLARHFLHKFDPFVVCNKKLTDADDLFPKYKSSLVEGDDSLHTLRKEDIKSREESKVKDKSYSTKDDSRDESTSKTDTMSKDESTLKEDISQSLAKQPKRKPQIAYRWEPVIRLQCPIVVSAHLPGPLYYMLVRRPGRDLPFEVQLCLPRKGHTLLTEKKINYFRLQLNSLHCVENLTCLSSKSFSSEIFSKLYGMHEAYFNKLLTRFTKKKVNDLFDYFVQPWMAVLYQETFDDLLFKMNYQKINALYDALTSYFYEISKTTQCRGLGICCTLERCCCRTGPSPIAIPSECGQIHFMHEQAKLAWEKIGGDNIVLCYLAKYLDEHSVINPHYARPISENLPVCSPTGNEIAEKLRPLMK